MKRFVCLIFIITSFTLCFSLFQKAHAKPGNEEQRADAAGSAQKKADRVKDDLGFDPFKLSYKEAEAKFRNLTEAPQDLSEVYRLNQQLIVDGRLHPDLPIKDNTIDPPILDKNGIPLRRNDGVVYISSRDHTLTRGLIEHIEGDGHGGYIPNILERQRSGRLFERKLTSDELETLLKSEEAKLMIEAIPDDPSKTPYAYRTEFSRELYGYLGYLQDKHPLIQYRWVSNSLEVNKVAIMNEVKGDPNDPCVRIVEIASNGEYSYRQLSREEIRSIRPLKGFRGVPSEHYYYRLLSPESFISFNGYVVKPGSVMVLRESLAEAKTNLNPDLIKTATFISLSFDERGEVVVTYRHPDGSTREHGTSAVYDSKQSNDFSLFSDSEELARLKAQPFPEGETWRVVGKMKDPERAGSILIARQKGARQTFEGLFPELIAHYPYFLERYGFRYENGNLYYPDVEAINARIIADPDSNGLLFWSDNSGKEATVVDYVRGLAEGRVVYASKGALHFHDIGAHGIGYILMPKEIVSIVVSRAKLFLELLDIPEIKNNPFLLNKMNDLVRGVDRLSADLVIGLIRRESGRLLKAEMNKYHLNSGYGSIEFNSSAKDIGQILYELIKSGMPGGAQERVLAIINKASDKKITEITDNHIDGIFKKVGLKDKLRLERRARIKEQMLPFPLRKAIGEKIESLQTNASGLARIWIAEEIKELWFSLTEDPERFVEFNNKLIESPESLLGFIASYEGFVLSEKATQGALGFQNGQLPDIRFLEKWSRVHAFSKVLVRSVPMAIGVTVMESLRKMMENKKLMEQLDQATLLERELFYVQVNNAILQSLILYANSACDALMDPETYENGLRIASELTAAGVLVHYGKKAVQLGKLYCAGARVRATAEAGSMTPPGWLAATVELTATFIIAEYLDVTLNSLISWWQEYSLRSNLENAKRKVREIKGAASSEESDYVAALREMKGAFEAYEAYLKKDVLIALLQGDRGAKKIEEYYNERIEKIRKREPIRVYGNFEAHAMGKMMTQSGELEERYERTNTGWRIIRTPIFDGKTSDGATGYWGGVWTPAQKIEMTDQEFEFYANSIVKENEQNRNSTIERILSVANQNALTIAKRIFGTDVDPENSGRITMRNLRENQIQFLQSLK